MYLIYKKKTKKIGMISKGQIKYDKSIFAEKEMALTKTQLSDISNSEETFYKNGKIITNPRIDKHSKIKELETELEQAKDLDKTKELIKKLINL